MSEVADTTRVMILGGGLEIDGDRARLSAVSAQRVGRAIKYYTAHRNHFASREAESWLLCSGGYPGLADGMTAPQDSEREGNLMRQALRAEGVHDRLIRVETNSASTVENFLFSRRDGLLLPDDFGAENPLGLVTHPQHMRRAVRVAAAVGIRAVQRIATEQPDSMARELVLRTLITGGTRNVERMRRREQFLGRMLGRAASATA